jgi:hypothetical protein
MWRSTSCELVCCYNRILQDYNARLRQLYPLVNLCFPEFTGPARTRDSQRAAILLRAYPTSRAFVEASIDTLACLRLDGRRRGGAKLAHELIAPARPSVGPARWVGGGERWQSQVNLPGQT